jgi:hypothetical protein
MEKAPRLINLECFVTQLPEWPRYQSGQRWLLARPMGLFSLRNRIYLAWLVFTGKADALVWPEDEHLVWRER